MYLLRFVLLYDGKCVVKTPFTTHGSAYRGRIYCKDLKEVLQRIRRLAKLSNYLPQSEGKAVTQVARLPYLIIQPRVENTEYKVLVVSGEAKLILTPACGFKTPICEIFLFAECVTRRLKEMYPETMVEYIMRVDMFEVDGKLKVNEFESFDADFLMTLSGSKRKYKQDDDTIRAWSDEDSEAFIFNFWIAKFHHVINLAQLA